MNEELVQFAVDRYGDYYKDGFLEIQEFAG